MNGGTVYLRVKIKSLAEEAKIIRLEESRAKARGDRELIQGLVWHRKMVVRVEARATQLAYAYLRGRALSQVEHHSDKPVPWSKVKSMIERYGSNKFDAKAFEEWVKGTQVTLLVE